MRFLSVMACSQAVLFWISVLLNEESVTPDWVSVAFLVFWAIAGIAMVVHRKDSFGNWF